MDFKKFLKDNKGCPLTVPAIKQLLIKFIELLSKKGVVKDEVSNIRELSKETLDELQVGDIVQKITGNQKHAYMVTYKGEGAGEGICLTYCAAGYMETVAYDRSGTDWVYNSTDVVNIEEALADKQDKLVSGENIKTVGGESLLGSGNIPLPSGGTQLYKHVVLLSTYDDITTICNSPTPVTTIDELLHMLNLPSVYCFISSANYGAGMYLCPSSHGFKYYDSDEGVIDLDVTFATISSDTVTPF